MWNVGQAQWVKEAAIKPCDLGLQNPHGRKKADSCMLLWTSTLNHNV